MDWKNCELHYLDHATLAEKGILVPATQPYSFIETSQPKINDEMRNGLDVKTKMGSPVFTVKSIYEETRDDQSVSIVELEFNHIDPTPYAKVPENS